MKMVTRYKCEWCGGEFKTADRHKCKYDPKFKNCLSCANRGKFVQGRSPTYDPYTLGLVDGGTSNGFDCKEQGEAGGGGWNDFSSGAVAASEHGCRDWKPIEGYKGKESYREYLRTVGAQ